MLDDINGFVKKETLLAIRSILEAHLDQDASSEERGRQSQVTKDVKARGVIASVDSSAKTDEAEDEEEKPDKEGAERQEDRTGGKGTADSPKLKSPKASQLKEPTTGVLIDKLNALRGGRSLKDPEVKKSFSQYLAGLTVREKQSLLIFLTGIAQVLAGSADGAEALDPGDVGLRVKGEIETDEEAKPEEKKPKPGREGSAENPIVVGESQDKRKILRAIAEYRRHT